MFAWVALPPWLRATLIALVAIAGLSALAGAGFWRGMARIEAMTLAAADGARKERDAHWSAEIEKSNSAVARVHAEQAARVVTLESEIASAEARSVSLENELERKNAELPNAAVCGLDAGRWRLLDGPAR